MLDKYVSRCRIWGLSCEATAAFCEVYLVLNRSGSTTVCKRSTNRSETNIWTNCRGRRTRCARCLCSVSRTRKANWRKPRKRWASWSSSLSIVALPCFSLHCCRFMVESKSVSFLYPRWWWVTDEKCWCLVQWRIRGRTVPILWTPRDIDIVRRGLTMVHCLSAAIASGLKLSTRNLALVLGCFVICLDIV